MPQNIVKMGSKEGKLVTEEDSTVEIDESKQAFETLQIEELKQKAKSEPNKLELGDWKRILTPEQYRVTRLKGTERPWTSDINDVDGPGIFVCSNCENPSFDSSTKYDSGSGWPSFYAPLDKTALTTDTDYDIGVARTEVHCAKCRAHFGHVFDDGPKPTGQRFCMNGASLKFQPKSS